MRRLWTVLAALATLSLTNCGYNAIQSQDEQVKSSWSEVVNQYQRRADLITNLVATVKGYAAQEERVLVEVTEARAKVGTIQATPELVNDQAAMNRFIQAQGQMTGALSRLLAVAENYPQLKASEEFTQLQGSLSQTEDSIQNARRYYNAVVRDLNTKIQSFPTNILAGMFGFQQRQFFEVAAGDREPVAVKF